MELLPNPIANPVCVLREEFDDWAVLFNPDTANAVGINPTGVHMWKLMDGQHSLEDIANAMIALFDEVPDTTLEDVRKFVDALAEQGFVGFEVTGSPE